MIRKKNANEARLRRHRHVRKKVSGTAARPRLSVFRSATRIYAQIVDDERGMTLVAASSRDPEVARAAPDKRAESKPAQGPSTAEPAQESARAGGQGASKGQAKGEAKGQGRATDESAASGDGDGAAKAGRDPLRGIAENRRVAEARRVGRLIAGRAKARGIERVVFDRGGYLYHGRVAALASGAREGGLEF